MEPVRFWSDLDLAPASNICIFFKFASKQVLGYINFVQPEKAKYCRGKKTNFLKGFVEGWFDKYLFIFTVLRFLPFWMEPDPEPELEPDSDLDHISEAIVHKV